MYSLTSGWVTDDCWSDYEEPSITINWHISEVRWIGAGEKRKDRGNLINLRLVSRDFCITLRWCLLAHNLWKLARIAVQQRESAAEQKEAAWSIDFRFRPLQGGVGLNSREAPKKYLKSSRKQIIVNCFVWALLQQNQIAENCTSWGRLYLHVMLEHARLLGNENH